VSDGFVEKQLDQLGLNEILTTLCPGVVLLASELLWLPLFGMGTASLQSEVISAIPVSILLLILAYGIGLVLNAWAAEGFVTFVRLHDARMTCRANVRIFGTLHYWIAALFHGRRFRVGSIRDVEARMNIYEVIRGRYGESVVGLLNPNNLMPIFRVLVSGEVKERDGIALDEAGGLARRRGFAEGMALGL